MENIENEKDIKTKLNLDWSTVESALAEGTFSGYKIGIIETEKLFNQLLQSKGVPGKSASIKLKYIKSFLSMPEKLDSARAIYKKIIGAKKFEISRDDTKKTIASYWQAMIDIEEAIKYLTITEKIKFKFQYFWGKIIRKIKKIILLILIVLTIFLFLGKTSIGQKILAYIILFSHWLIIKILLWPFILLIILYLIKFIVKFVKKTKKNI